MLLSQVPICQGEFANFVQACKLYDMTPDMARLHDWHKDLFVAQPVVPRTLDYFGNVFILSDSTLKARPRRTNAGFYGVKNDFK